MSTQNSGCEVGKEKVVCEEYRRRFAHEIIWTLGVGRYPWDRSKEAAKTGVVAIDFVFGGCYDFKLPASAHGKRNISLYKST